MTAALPQPPLQTLEDQITESILNYFHQHAKL